MSSSGSACVEASQVLRPLTSVCVAMVHLAGTVLFEVALKWVEGETEGKQEKKTKKISRADLSTTCKKRKRKGRCTEIACRF
ncbi:hypothetical protein KPH14_010771 [Odynerus spinipes]|uniref:Uncharacterized protein n=1 Tax=Odynerus spinipes TaxID=1348599 RepID=A0AAD9VM97_9HYME|nr:hypothetical protein KPH14_010771 [Odynerus spinipes]